MVPDEKFPPPQPSFFCGVVANIRLRLVGPVESSACLSKSRCLNATTLGEHAARRTTRSIAVRGGRSCE